MSETKLQLVAFQNTWSCDFNIWIKERIYTKFVTKIADRVFCDPGDPRL
jgi:hypothetical protein